MNYLTNSLKVTLFFSFVTGCVYPCLITGIGNLLYHDKAQGSYVSLNGQVVGSELIAQKFTQDKYFFERPSAIDYNPQNSGGSNLSVDDPRLLKLVEERKETSQIEDLLYSSGIGLDPEISLSAVLSQVDRVAVERSLSPEGKQKLSKLITQFTLKPQFGILGTERVNVLMLNIAMDQNL